MFRVKTVAMAMACALLAAGAAAWAEDAAPQPLLQSMLSKTPIGKSLQDAGIKVYGYIEGSYTYNLDAPQTNINEGRLLDFEHDAPRMNQLDLQIEKAVDITDLKGKIDIGGKIEMYYGSDARFLHSHGMGDYHQGPRSQPLNQFDLEQAYLSLGLPIGSGLLIQAGKFATPLGYETTNPTTNPFYSRNYLFDFGVPGTHTGITATYNLSKSLTIMAGVTRGWDQSTEDNNGAIDFIGSVTYALNDDYKIIGVVSVGPQNSGDNSHYRSMIDLQFTGNLTKQLTMAIDGAFAWDTGAAGPDKTAYWYGVTGYLGYKLNDYLTLNARAEWFRDEQAVRIGQRGSFYEITLGVTIKPFPTNQYGAGLSIRPEIREDISTDRFFDGGTRRDQTTLAVDMIYAY